MTTGPIQRLGMLAAKPIYDFDRALESAAAPKKDTPKDPGKDVATPAFGEYKHIEVVEDNKRLTYTTLDGKQVVVDKALDPELYKVVLADYRTLEAMKDGFTLSRDNDDVLMFLDYNDPSKVDRRHEHEGVIMFEFGANKMVINERLTPDTFKRFSRLKHLQQSPSSGELVNPSYKLPLATADYKSIRVLEEGVVQAEMTAGKTYVVSRDLTPSQFAQLESIGKAKSALETFKGQGYELVNELPKSVDPNKLKIDAVDKETGVIAFEYDSKRYAISKLDALDWDMAHAEDLVPQPGIYLDGWIQRPTASETVGGTKLIDTLLDFHAVSGTPAEQAFKDAYDKDLRVVDDAQPVPKLAQIESIEVSGEGVLMVKWGRGDTQVVLEAIAPAAYERFMQMHSTLEGISAAEKEGFRLAGNDDYLSSTEDVKDIGVPDQLGQGLITYVVHKPGGEEQKFVVSADYNPALHAQLLEAATAKQMSPEVLSELRTTYNIPADSELSVDTLATTEKDEKGSPLSLQDLQFKLMYDEYKAGVESGSIDKNDPRAKFIRALDAKSRVENGMPIVPHGSVDTIFVAPGEPMWLESRDVRDTIFDARAVDEALAKGISDPQIQKDLERFKSEARSKVEGGEEKINAVEQRLEALAGSDDLRLYLKALEDAGQGDAAKMEVQRIYMGLAHFDVQKADDFVRDLSRDGWLMELDKIMGDPGSVSAENAALAGSDTTNFILRAMRAAGDMPSHLINAYETTFQKIYQNKATAADIDKVWRELGETAKVRELTTDDVRAAMDKTESFKASGFSPLSASEKSNVFTMFAHLKDAGVLGSVSGTMGLIRGIYQLVGNPTNLAATAEGRLVIASDFVTFLSFSNGFMTLGSKTYDSLFNTHTNAKFGLSTPIQDLLWGADPTVTYPLGAAGLQDELHKLTAVEQRNALKELPFDPDLLDADARDTRDVFRDLPFDDDVDPRSSGGGLNPDADRRDIFRDLPFDDDVDPRPQGGVSADADRRDIFRDLPFDDDVDPRVNPNVDHRDIFRDLPFDDDVSPTQTPSEKRLTPSQIESFSRGMINGGGVKYGVSASVGYRIAGSVSRFLGAGGDFAGGVIGIVLGAFGLRGGIQSGDKLQIAAGSLGIVGGLGSTVAGLGSIGSAFGITGTLGRVLSFAGPLGFITGAAMGFVGAFLSIARSEQLKKMSQRDWKDIEDFKNDGLLKEGGDEAYAWVQTYMHNWGQRDSPKDQSIFDFRSDEWERRETRRTLDHENYAGDGDNAWQTEFPEPSAGNFVQ